MNAGLLETLQEDFHKKLLALDATILRRVHAALAKEGVCAQLRKNSTDEHVVDALQILMMEMSREEDVSRLNQLVTSAIGSLAREKERRWTSNGEVTPSTVLCILLGLGFARLSQLDLLEESESASPFLSRTVVKTLTQFPSLKAALSNHHETLKLDMVIRGLVILMLVNFRIGDKSMCVRFANKFGVHIKDILEVLLQSCSILERKQQATELCTFWLSTVDQVSAIHVLRQILIACQDSPRYHRIFLTLAEGQDKLALIFSKDVEALTTENRDQAAFRRFWIEHTVSCSRVLPRMDQSVIQSLLCFARHDKDAQLRCLAWKTLSVIADGISKGIRQRIVTFATRSLVMESAKSVGAMILKLIHQCLPYDVSTHSDIIACQRYLLSRMTNMDSDFPASWIPDACNLLSKGSYFVPEEFFMEAFTSSNRAGRLLIGTAYRKRLALMETSQAISEVQSLANIVSIETARDFEDLIHIITREDIADGSELVKRLQALLIRTLSTSESNDHASTSLLLASTMLTITLDSNLKDSLLRACLGYLESGIGQQIEREMFVALRGARRVLEVFPSPALKERIQDTLQSHMTDLFARVKLQREIVKLLYKLDNPQELVYYFLALLQEDAFKDLKSLVRFIALLGVIATENAAFVAQTEEKEIGMSDEADPETDDVASEDYMESYRSSIRLKLRIKHATESSVSDGLLSAYLPLVHRVLVEGPSVELRVVSMWTLGEFMKLSQTVSQGYFKDVLALITNEDVNEVVRVQGIDVWASLQPSMRPSEEKEHVTVMMYSLLRAQSSRAVVLQTLNRLQALVLAAQLKSDRLQDFGRFLLSGNDEERFASERFFREYLRKQHATKVSSSLYEIYFALQNEFPDEERDESTTIGKKLVDIAVAVGHSVDSFQVMLADELPSPARAVHALRLLEQLGSLAPTVIRKVVDFVGRLELYSDIPEVATLVQRILVKSKQRVKDKSEKDAINAALIQIQGKHSTPDNRHTRHRLSLDVASIGKHITDLRG